MVCDNTNHRLNFCCRKRRACGYLNHLIALFTTRCHKRDACGSGDVFDSQELTPYHDPLTITHKPPIHPLKHHACQQRSNLFAVNFGDGDVFAVVEQ